MILILKKGELSGYQLSLVIETEYSPVDTKLFF